MNGTTRMALGAALLTGGALLGGCAGQDPGVPDTGSASAAADRSATPSGTKRAGGSPCTSTGAVMVIAPGENLTPTVWQSAIVLTNQGSVPCTVRGVSSLEFYTGGDGRPLGVRETTTGGLPQELVTLGPGEKAAMSLRVATAPDPAPPDCLQGAAFAQVTLPGDSSSVEAWMADESLFPPPVCGPVEVGPWVKGSAPGVN